MPSDLDSFLNDGKRHDFGVKKEVPKKEKGVADTLRDSLSGINSVRKGIKVDRPKEDFAEKKPKTQKEAVLADVIEDTLYATKAVPKVVTENKEEKETPAQKKNTSIHAKDEFADSLSDVLKQSIPEMDLKPKVSIVGPKDKEKELPSVRKSRDGIAEFLEKSLPNSTFIPEILEVGEVAYIGDGICKVIGLSNARIDDVLKVETEKGDVLILVLGISNDLVETVVLGDYFAVKKGNLVFSTQKNLKIPAGKGVLGRIISPIGEPLDGKGAIVGSKEMDVERPAPAVYMRTPIVDQLKTGFLVIDSIIPVGRGQRELVTGDRKTGKTRLMTDILCNLKNQDIFCVYVGIGAQKAKIKSIAEYLEKYGALQNTAIVMGSSDDPPSLNYLAPYAGTAIAEYFCDNGHDAFIIYDDLSKHAKAYRQMSLLLKRSPGRDAYPGDIFYLHSRLLERTAKVLPDYGGGSITAMPMCETQNGDISEYITTNLMSITDGHIYLDAQMMHDGVLPAVNSGSSVSRIGGSIQPKLLRKLGAIAGGQLARYNEVKSYETMNTEITEETEREINRGKRILEIFTQPSGMNYTPAEETLLLHTVTGGLLDYVPLDIVSNMKVELINFYRDNLKDFNTITDISGRKDADDKDFSPFDDFIKQYVTRNNTPASNALKEVIDKKNEQKAAVQPKEGQKLEEVQAGSQATKPGTTEEEKANPEKEETASKEDANPEKGGQAKDESAKESQSKSDSNNQDGKKDK